jgi:hypothetical protein
MRNASTDTQNERVFKIENDMYMDVGATTVDVDGWTATFPSGTVETGDALGGELVLTCNAAGNILQTYNTTRELFLQADDAPINFVAKGVELTTNPTQSNVFIGVMNALATTPLQDVGAGTKATGDHIGFYKPEDGGTFDDDFWHCVSQHDGAVQTTELSAGVRVNMGGVQMPAVLATTANVLDLQCTFHATNRVSATTFDGLTKFWINGVLVCVHKMNGANIITDADSTLMNAGVALLNTATAEAITVDYIKCEQVRVVN